MYDAVDLVELKRMADLAEATPEWNRHVPFSEGYVHLFRMNRWLTPHGCGTAGCLVGTWCLHTPGDDLHMGINQAPALGSEELVADRWSRPMVDHIGRRFGLPPAVATFLFRSKQGNVIAYRYPFVSAVSLSKAEAIARLRMYIAYVERKRALFAEHDWLMSLSRKDRQERLLSPRKNVELADVTV